MPAIGGSIESINLDGRDFAVAADADVNRKVGGFENEISPNGNRTSRILKTAVPWSLAGVVIEIDDARGDHEFLQALADSNDYFAVGITLASGVTWGGNGMIVGENPASSATATATMDLMGQGVLTQQ